MWLIESYATAIQGKFQFSSLQISPHRLQDMKELKTKVEQVLLQRYPQTTAIMIDNAEDLVEKMKLRG